MTPAGSTPPGRWRIGPGVFTARPNLMIAAGLGLALGLGLGFGAPGLRPSSCAIAGWNLFCVTYIAFTLHALAGRGPAEIRARAALQDQGQGVVLLLILAACLASLAAVALELSLARHDAGLVQAARVTGAFVTVAASWLTVQLVFAVHYAHAYYAVDPSTGGDAGGLAFPGGEPPDYWDFLHFAIVIGVANQTADVAFTAKPMRRLGSVHSLIAFAFNTLVVALTINLLTGLF